MQHAGQSWWHDHADAVSPTVGLRPFDPSRSVDLVVVGAGGAGLSCAIVAAKAGMRVCVIDVAGPGSGAAGRNGGLLLAGFASFFHDAQSMYGEAAAITGYQLTLAELDRVSQSPGARVRCLGSSRIAFDNDEARDLQAHHEALRAAGFDSQLRSDRELYIASDATFDPLSRVRSLATDASQLGVQFVVGTHVDSLDKLPVEAPIKVVCIDGGLEQLLTQLKHRVTSRRLHMIATAPVGPTLSHGIYRRYGMDYAMQAPDGSLLLGGYRDADPCAAVTTHATPDMSVTSLLQEWALTLDANAVATHQWVGACAWTDDLLPICEEIQPGTWAVGAYAGTGNLWSTMCGRAVASAITGREPNNLAVIELLASIRRDRTATAKAPI